MINIAELLKNAPKDLKLYSPICGHCKLSCILHDDGIRVIAHDVPFRFDKYGRFCSADDAECLLFPGEDCRTWEGWKLPSEPKFEVGNWLYHNSNGIHPVLVTDYDERHGYQIQDGSGRYHLSRNLTENEYRLWTISDARDGDVLAADNGWTCIFQAFDGYVFSSYCFMDSQNWFCESGSEVHTLDSRINGNIHPANKEQCNQFFTKMKEVGYIWDAEKKELRKIIKPKFKVGDWIVQNDNGTVSQITKTINGKDEYGEYRAYEHTNGYFAACFENEFHLWAIQDAKDGDVLVTTKIRNCPFIYRKTSRNNGLAYYYAGVDGDGNFCEGCLKRTLYHFGSVENVVPATKEQRDLLFAKMQEAGYEWDAEKKELKKIQKHYDISSFHAGMPVLVRDSDKHKWLYTIFGIYNKDNSLYPFVVVNMRGYEQCIPFNEKTKHLLGTTEPCGEEFINW